MSRAFIEFRNAANTVLIDNTWKNFMVRAAGSVTLQNQVPVSITYTGANPLIAIACSNMDVWVESSASGNTWTYTFRYFNGGGPYSCNYWIFDDPPDLNTIPGPPSGFAILELRDEAGNITFRADIVERLMKVVDFQDRTDISTTTSTTYPGGRRYAVIPGGDYYQSYRISPPTPIIFHRSYIGWRVADNVVSRTYIATNITATSAVAGRRFQMMVVDVTNLPTSL